MNFPTLLTIFVLGIPLGSAYIQELIFFKDSSQQGPNVTFTTDIPDSSAYDLENTAVLCARGFWLLYFEKNYNVQMAVWSSNDENLSCTNTTFPASPASFRFGGYGLTTIPALSLFSEVNFQGTEMMILEPMEALGGSWKSVLYTGECVWELYEEENYGGGFEMTPQLPDPNFPQLEIGGAANVTELWGLAQVRSVLMACP